VRDLGALQRELGRALLELPGSVHGSTSDSLRTAITIHRNTAIKGLVDALAANYPTVRQLVGDECFQAAAVNYARRYPARSPVLALYGESFAAFLDSLVPSADLPYLPEVARIDRMWVETLMAPDARAMAPSSLAALSVSSLTVQRIALHPATRFAWVRHSAATIWIHHRSAQAGELQIADSEEGVLLTRPEGTVTHAPLDGPAFTFLKSLRDGASLAAAATIALQADATADVAGTLARSIIAGAFAELPRSHS
jgi:hypothetical protein